jgi:nucleoside-specific outer membrane channel protein Tsx
VDVLKSFFCFICLILAVDAEEKSWYEPEYVKHSIAILKGNTYEVGERRREVGTVDHFSVWKWGEIYSFVDYTFFDEQDDETYFEIKPKLSLSYLSGESLEYGIIKDFFLATEFNYSSEKTTEVYLGGLGVKLEVPGFQWWNMNLYYREDVKAAGGGTYQFSTDWGIPFQLHDKFKFQFEGFADFAGTEGHSKHNIIFSPQILMDLGHFVGQSDKLYIGAEYTYWQNKFGIDGVDEEVCQFIVKFYF